MATQPEPVAGVAFVDSPSLVLPAPYPTLVSSGGTLGVIAAGSSTVSPIGGGGGGVATVTGAASGIVDNTDPANPVVQAQFGSDTTVPLPNAGSDDVPALELIASLVVNTVGSEVSQWLLKLLSAGAQVSSYVFGVLGLKVPLGTQASPSIDLGGTASGMYKQATYDNRLVSNGVSVLSFDETSGLTNLVIAGAFAWGNGVSLKQGGPNNANAIVSGAATGNAEMGPAGALATNATAGFANMPTCAGAPTGAVANVSAGKAPMVFDTTNNKIWFNVGGTTWKGVVVA